MGFVSSVIFVISAELCFFKTSRFFNPDPRGSPICYPAGSRIFSRIVFHVFNSAFDGFYNSVFWASSSSRYGFEVIRAPKTWSVLNIFRPLSKLQYPSKKLLPIFWISTR